LESYNGSSLPWQFLNKTLSTDTASKLKDCFCPLHLTNPINNASHKTHLNEELEADKDSRTNQSSNAIKKQSTNVFVGGSTKNLEDLNIFLANNLTWCRTAFLFDDKNPETPKFCRPFFVEAIHEMSNALNKRNGKTWFNENSELNSYLAIKFASWIAFYFGMIADIAMNASNVRSVQTQKAIALTVFKEVVETKES